MFNIERLIGVLFPLKRLSACNKKKNNICIFSILSFALIFYSAFLLTAGIEVQHHESTNPVKSCVTIEKWIGIAKFQVFSDIILTMLVPFVLILISNILIIFKLTDVSLFKKGKSISIFTLRSKFKRKKYLSRDGSCSSFEYTTECTTPQRSIRKSISLTDQSSCEIKSGQIKIPLKSIGLKNDELSRLARRNSSLNIRQTGLSKTMKLKRTEKYSRTTRVLIFISITFLMLHAPIAYSKIRYYYKSGLGFDTENDAINDVKESLNELSLVASQKNITFTSSELFEGMNMNSTNIQVSYMEANDSDEIFERITCYIYYLNFSLNFFLYALAGATFRRELFNMFKFFIRKKSLRIPKSYSH